MRRAIVVMLIVALAALAAPAGAGRDTAKPGFRVLVFSKTEGFRHDSIAAGVETVRSLGARHTFAVDATEDAGVFTARRLSRYAVVVWLNTTGDVLDAPQERAFERYIRRGGGFAGVHSAADTEYGWRFYGRLMGARFRQHPAIQQATIHVTDRRHPSTRRLPRRWTRTDEWYDYRARPSRRVRILATLDESTYSGGSMGDPHPIAWCRTFEDGRAWYTGGGHTAASYAEARFRRHLLGGIRWAAGRR